jgi:uncharacterized protein (DUF1810 family)
MGGPVRYNTIKNKGVFPCSDRSILRRGSGLYDTPTPLGGRVKRGENMRKKSDGAGREDPFDLGRFLKAQAGIYDRVVAELRGGRKRTHWMWFIFPQIDGLGHSATSKYYAVKSIEEAREYLKHPVLGSRLLECTEAVFAIEGRGVSEIFNYPDDLKLKSSMTLFASVAEPGNVFARVLEKYFQGMQDTRTLRLLQSLKE